MILSAVPVACVVQSAAPGFKLQRTGLQVRVCSALDASGPKIRPRQTPKSPMPGHRGLFSRSRQNRDSRFPESGIPAKSGFPISRIRDSGQIGTPDFPKSGIPAKSGFKSGKIPIFFEAARTVIAHCQRQARLLRFLVGVPGWEKRLIIQLIVQ